MEKDRKTSREDDEDLKDKKKKKKGRNQESENENEDRRRESEKDEEDDETDDDRQDRRASFFNRILRDGEDESVDGERSDDKETDPDDGESEPQIDEVDRLTEAEVNEAVGAMVDGLSRELRNEFDQVQESSIAELETVVVAAFLDSLKEKIESGDRDITEELLDEALREALEDLLDTDGQSQSRKGKGNPPPDPQSESTPNPLPPLPNSPQHQIHAQGVAEPIDDVIDANANNSTMANNESGKRGKGMLLGGIVGYIIGRRHARKHTEARLRSEVELLENQMEQLYEALASRERMIRQIVNELADRQVGGKRIDPASLISRRMIGSSPDRSASSAVETAPSLIMPVAFAALLVTYRLRADTGKERHTKGKDIVVGGLAGYMIGRRHGRQIVESEIKSEMELLEDQMNELQDDMTDKDFIMDRMVKIVAEADGRDAATAVDLSVESTSEDSRRSGKITGAPAHGEKKHNPLASSEKQLVDASIDRIALSRKNREAKKHQDHLIESGKATEVGGNLLSSVFIERRLMDGTENNPGRKQIEAMNEDELLAMSSDIYVDERSVVDLYDKGRVDLEVLRTSVTHYWRKSGDYQQLLRANLRVDESAVDDIRDNLKEAYRSILNEARDRREPG